MEFLKYLYLIKENIMALRQYQVFGISIFQIASALLIIILAIALRQVFVKVILKYIKKLTQRTNTKLDDKLISAVEVPARFLCLITGIWLAIKVLDLSFITNITINMIYRSLIIFTIFWSLYLASDTISYYFEKLTQKSNAKLDDVLVSFLRKVFKIIIVVLGIVLIAQEWRFNLGAVVAGLGLGGLAFALAAKDTVANLFGGITIMIDRPFSIGDWIITPQVEGTVEELGLRSTRVRTFDLSLVSIPNSVMVNESITNRSSMGKRRISFQLGLTYATNAQQMEECVNRLRDMLKQHPHVDPDAVYVFFQNFGDSSLDILIYFFSKEIQFENYLKVKQDVYLKIMKIVEELGLSVAFPSTSVYIEKN